MASTDSFSHVLTLRIPFPTAHLASTALRALAVDKELSSLVTRTYSLDSDSNGSNDAEQKIMVVRYAATTNRMLRVSITGFFNSLATVLHVMEELDVDVCTGEVKEPLDRVQGLENGIK